MQTRFVCLKNSRKLFILNKNNLDKHFRKLKKMLILFKKYFLNKFK